MPGTPRISDWIRDIPEEFSVRVYNKGAAISSRPVLERADSIVHLANTGRESDTFLRHILACAEAGTGGEQDGHVVFLQGDPFEHSPDVIALLGAAAAWQPVQPLSWCWLASKNLPPANLLARETGGFVDGLRVRPELFSLGTWNQVQFVDPGATTVRDLYHAVHGLPEGTNIAAHFLHSCGWTELATQAERHLVGRFSYGALFAVRRDRIAGLPRGSLERALEAANGHPVYGYVLERLWLHLFGEPFLLPTFEAGEQGAGREAMSLGAPPAARFVPRPPPTPRYRRVVPALKRRISRWARG